MHACVKNLALELFAKEGVGGSRGNKMYSAKTDLSQNFPLFKIIGNMLSQSFIN